MFKIDKKEEPEFFKKFKIRSKPHNWSECDFSIKKELKNYMLEYEQNYYCPYCELKINVEESQVEHIKPKEKFPELMHEYSNYLTGCKSPKTCGQFKANQWSEKFIDPTVEDPEEYFTYDIKTGKIIPKEKERLKVEKADYTIKVLNLNDKRLCEIRKTFIEQNLKNMECLDYIDKFPSLKEYLKENFN